MEYIVTLLRMLALVVSCYGYVRFLSRKIPTEFALSVLFTGICSTMFFSGILNILKESAYLILIIGMLLTVDSLRKKEKIKEIICPGIIFFIVAALALIPIMRGMIFTDYDDFSHWGTVVKVLYTQNRFPNFSDKIITYQSYPTGSASLIYYFLITSGIRAEWFQLYVQAIFMLGILSGFFVFAKDLLGWITTTIAAGVFLLCNNGLINLLVDTLLPIVALGGLCICIYYRNTLEKSIFWIIPHLISLVSIKNSGVIFAVFVLVFALLYFYRKKLTQWVVVCAVPLVSLLLWQKHVMLVFGNGLNARHSMSVEYVTKTYLAKSYEEYATIIEAYWKELISLTNPALYLLVLIVLVIFLIRILHEDISEVSRKLAFLSVFCYFVYVVAMLGMYLSTMPYGEAIRLAGFARYHRSILIFCGGCLYCATAVLFSGNGKQHKIRFVASVVLLTLCYHATFPGLWYNNPKHCGFIREDFEECITNNNVELGRSYCVILDSQYASKYSGYLRYASRYLLDSTNILVCSIEDYQKRETGWDGYDYLICFGESDEMRNFLERTFEGSEQSVYSALTDSV